LLRRLGSRQIRNRGTLGGNIGNASPIGDSPPVLLALDATLVLRRGTERRMLALDDFFSGYRCTALGAGEFIERIDVPLPQPGVRFRCYKVAKRFDQDISAVCAAFRVELVEGRVRDIRIGFGGMAATPVRARNTEQVLVGQSWTAGNVQTAMDALDAELSPISDMRASAAYRRMVARNLLYKCFLETSAPGTVRTRLAVPA
jgi:xanthine dehydrogenase small subunit